MVCDFLLASSVTLLECVPSWIPRGDDLGAQWLITHYTPLKVNKRDLNPLMYFQFIFDIQFASIFLCQDVEREWKALQLKKKFCFVLFCLFEYCISLHIQNNGWEGQSSLDPCVCVCVCACGTFLWEDSFMFNHWSCLVERSKHQFHLQGHLLARNTELKSLSFTCQEA